MQNQLKQLSLNVQNGYTKSLEGLARFAEISARQNTITPWEPSYSQHPKNYKTSSTTTPDTTLNTGSAGMTQCKRSTEHLDKVASTVSIYDPQNGRENVSRSQPCHATLYRRTDHHPSDAR